jgi:nucleoside permease NupC
MNQDNPIFLTLQDIKITRNHSELVELATRVNRRSLFFILGVVISIISLILLHAYFQFSMEVLFLFGGLYLSIANLILMRIVMPHNKKNN